MTRTMVRYKVLPDHVARNEELIRAVFDELREVEPAAFRYDVFVLDDGVSFVHIVEHEHGANPLPALPAFKRYVAEVRERCEEQPIVAELRRIGSIPGQVTPAPNGRRARYGEARTSADH